MEGKIIDLNSEREKKELAKQPAVSETRSEAYYTPSYEVDADLLRNGWRPVDELKIDENLFVNRNRKMEYYEEMALECKVVKTFEQGTKQPVMAIYVKNK